MNFIPCSVIYKSSVDDAYLCLVDGNRILIKSDYSGFPRLISDSIDSNWQIGVLDGVPCLACSFVQWNAPIPHNSVWVDFRTVFHMCESAVAFSAARASELLSWRNMHQYCGRCANKLYLSNSEIALRCTSCSALYYPQIAPAVIVLITKGNKEILLAHNRKFKNGIYSLIAGFIEAGESAEQAVHREIKEEIGITVKNLHYSSSQCWPYPNSLMLAFTAEYESGIIAVDGMEIDSAAFFTRDNMPSFPRQGSIAAFMIESWLNRF